MDITDAGRRGVRQLVRELEEAVDVAELRSRAVRALALPAESFHADPAVIYEHPVDRDWRRACSGRTPVHALALWGGK